MLTKKSLTEALSGFLLDEAHIACRAEIITQSRRKQLVALLLDRGLSRWASRPFGRSTPTYDTLRILR